MFSKGRRKFQNSKNIIIVMFALYLIMGLSLLAFAPATPSTDAGNDDTTGVYGGAAKNDSLSGGKDPSDGKPDQDIFQFEYPNVPLIGGTPLTAPHGERTWALLNIILAGAGLILALVQISRFLIKRKRENEESEKEKYIGYSSDVPGDDAKKDKCQGKSAITVLSLLSLTAVVLTIFTQDERGTMGLMDFWTSVHAALLIGEIFAVKVLNKANTDDKNDQNDKFQPA